MAPCPCRIFALSPVLFLRPNKNNLQITSTAMNQTNQHGPPDVSVPLMEMIRELQKEARHTPVCTINHTAAPHACEAWTVTWRVTDDTCDTYFHPSHVRGQEKLLLILAYENNIYNRLRKQVSQASSVTNAYSTYSAYSGFQTFPRVRAGKAVISL